MSNPGSQALSLNLGIEEYIIAAEHQVKPLIIPLCAEIPARGLSPTGVFRHFCRGRGYLLESIEGSEKIARYSYIGTEPELVISIGPSIRIEGKEPYLSIAKNPGGSDPIAQLASVLRRFNYVNVKAPRFFGGMVGYLSYDLVYSLYEPVLISKKPVSDVPVAQFMLTKDCLVFDHRKQSLFVFCSPLLTYDSDLRAEYRYCRDRIAHTVEAIVSLRHKTESLPGSPAPDEQSGSGQHSMSREEFMQGVLRVKDHIRAGDIFQGVISRRIDMPFAGDPFPVYRALREINPSPYMYYLDFGPDLQVIGASPEMLVRVERRQVTTVPIAGTRPRGRTPEEDKAFATELIADEKERAEHTMLVDLARNDLGRVCKYGSIRVDDFMSVEQFSHVQHIVSTVQGALRDNLDAYEALKSCFPAGTVSGAPKVRAMQIIDEVEPERRGLYAGAVGFMGFDQTIEFAITIRTLVASKGVLSVQVGAGIVADSIPANEWEETGNKASAMVNAVRNAGRYL